MIFAHLRHKYTQWLRQAGFLYFPLNSMSRGDLVHTPSSSHSRFFDFLTAMVISTFVTLMTFLPLLFHFGLTSPLPQGDANYDPSPYPDPGPCYGNNSWIHDPSIIYDNGIYWRFSTSGNIAVATAPSVRGPWTYKGALLPGGTKVHVAPNQDIWVHLCFRSSHPKKANMHRDHQYPSSRICITSITRSQEWDHRPPKSASQHPPPFPVPGQTTAPSISHSALPTTSSTPTSSKTHPRDHCTLHSAATGPASSSSPCPHTTPSSPSTAAK